MSRKDVTINTRDGEARAHVFTPDQGAGPWPAVIFFMDGMGIRPALFEMGERLAGHGYYVLLPDMFWRYGPYPPIEQVVAGDAEKRTKEIGLRMTSTDAVKSLSDTRAFVAFLDGQPEVKGKKVGVTGYCMGGAMALRAAGTFPERVAAAASIHGGSLATDSEHSPHRLLPQMKAKVLVAVADNDAYFPPEQEARLAEAFRQAGTDAEMRTYHGALHGFAPPGGRFYDREASERHWREMLALFDSALK
jgi:carboxymethylenebutenolidase